MLYSRSLVIQQEEYHEENTSFPRAHNDDNVSRQQDDITLGIYEIYAREVAFHWLLRSVAVDQPHYTSHDLLELEASIDATLDSLLSAPEEAWNACQATLDLTQPGDAFCAAILAFTSLDIKKIQWTVDGCLSKGLGIKGLVSAYGWLPDRYCKDWIGKFLVSKDLNHKYLGVAACSIRREDPGQYLWTLLQRKDCLADANLHARCLRLIGELKRTDLISSLDAACTTDDDGVRFWANWSAVLLGQAEALARLKPFAMTANPFQEQAITISFRTLCVTEARQWMAQLARDASQKRQVVLATAALGDPEAIDWLINTMRDPKLSRLAGEAFSFITGIDLEQNALAIEVPDLSHATPSHDPQDETTDLDRDEYLPWPDVGKLTAVWQKYGNQYIPGKRYFMGRDISEESLMQYLASGYQRQRHVAALELALLCKEEPLVNTCRKLEAAPSSFPSA